MPIETVPITTFSGSCTGSNSEGLPRKFTFNSSVQEADWTAIYSDSNGKRYISNQRVNTVFSPAVQMRWDENNYNDSGINPMGGTSGRPYDVMMPPYSSSIWVNMGFTVEADFPCVLEINRYATASRIPEEGVDWTNPTANMRKCKIFPSHKEGNKWIAYGESSGPNNNTNKIDVFVGGLTEITNSTIYGTWRNSPTGSFTLTWKPGKQYWLGDIHKGHGAFYDSLEESDDDEPNATWEYVGQCIVAPFSGTISTPEGDFNGNYWDYPKAHPTASWPKFYFNPITSSNGSPHSGSTFPTGTYLCIYAGGAVSINTDGFDTPESSIYISSVWGAVARADAPYFQPLEIADITYQMLNYDFPSRTPYTLFNRFPSASFFASYWGPHSTEFAQLHWAKRFDIVSPTTLWMSVSGLQGYSDPKGTASYQIVVGTEQPINKRVEYIIDYGYFDINNVWLTSNSYDVYHYSGDEYRTIDGDIPCWWHEGQVPNPDYEAGWHSPRFTVTCYDTDPKYFLYRLNPS